MQKAEVRIKLREGAVAWQEVEGEVILLDLSRSEYICINPSGSLLWSALAVGATRMQLVDRLRTAYGIPEAQAVADVDIFLASCRERGFLEP